MEPEALAAWFDRIPEVLETNYTQAPPDEPWKQSGMSGPAERWAALRRPVADAIHKSGSLLDIGCANGYLLECVVAWTAERGLTIEPFGLDISPRLAALARQRLPQAAGNIWVGNRYTWLAPRRFDFVRTELVYVPAEYERAYVDRLLADVVAPGGRLLICNYAERHPDPARGLLPGSHPTRLLLDRLAELGVQADACFGGYDAIKGRHTRVAVLKESSE